MSGHSKWANIKHKKGAADAKKGRIFSKYAKEIMVAVKNGGKDPESNPRLRLALAGARASNMPRENIDRAIKKGAGELGDVVFEEITYEGYGPAGTALIIECLSDNRNRTLSDVRLVLDAGAEDLEVEDGTAEIWAAPEAFDAISKALEAAGIETTEAGITRKADNTVEIKDASVAGQVLRLIDKLEDLDDVQAVHSNADIPDEIMEQVEED